MKTVKNEIVKEPAAVIPPAADSEDGMGSDPAKGLKDESLLFEINLERLLQPLVALLNLEACEVYLRHRQNDELYRAYHSGRLGDIWKLENFSDQHEFLNKKMNKGEPHIINLPNRRLQDLNPLLKEKAFGQVVCCPIMVDKDCAGFFCAAHTRQNLLTENEMHFLTSMGEWIGDVITSAQKNQQIRTQIIGEERERIGMDLHDGIIQSLYGIGLSMENARLSLEQGKNGTQQMIETSLQGLQSAIADIRAYILNLRPRQLRHSNLFEGMQSLLRELRANTMIEVELEGSADDCAGLAREQTDALYHIFQEALSNIAKHARASKVSVRLWKRDERLLLRINDDGSGFELSKPGRRAGHGLNNMRARAESAGGGMEVVSIRKQGTTLLAWVPLVLKEKL